GMHEARHLLPAEVSYCDEPYDVCADADAVILLTEWNAYRGLDLERVKHLMRGKVFIDLRNVYERGTVEGLGFEYHCVGR
ncbi:MAG: UDP-glucose/GDP-mannose dehydrogenase family protein, partial [Gammaproteobacteria bacterium]